MDWEILILVIFNALAFAVMAMLLGRSRKPSPTLPQRPGARAPWDQSQWWTVRPRGQSHVMHLHLAHPLASLHTQGRWNPASCRLCLPLVPTAGAASEPDIKITAATPAGKGTS